MEVNDENDKILLDNKEFFVTIESFKENSEPEIVSLGKRIIVKEGALFRILRKDIKSQLFVIEILDEPDFENKIFGIVKSDIINRTRLYDGDKPRFSFVTSAITIPIKMRPGNGKSDEENVRYFDFEGNINIGLTAGGRSRIPKNGTTYLNYLLGVSIGSTKITSNTADITSETNASTLTPFIGLMFEYNDFEIGVFTGWDHIGGKLGRSWNYQVKMWIGIGLGYNIFTTKNKTPE